MNSCKSDDDNPEENRDNILVNTTWEGDTEEDGIYTFTSNTEYTFKDPGEPFFDGTYTFDGRNGILNEIVSNSSFPFEIVGDTMIITYPSGNSRTYYKK
ncbi:hypothetical protein [Marinirhabdus gelatinilytica]|nr:hypothetical protein [Marinirhabdus gelatinilytica]